MTKTIKYGILVAAGILAMRGALHAATYNFYFNNTEQGPNSTASPMVTVNGEGKPSTISPPVDKSEERTGSTLTQEQRDGIASFFKKFRFGIGWNNAKTKQSAAYNYVTESGMGLGSSNEYEDELEGFGANLGFSFNSYFGLEAFVTSLRYTGSNMGAVVFGGGLEVTPVRLSLFGAEDVVSLSALGGASNAFMLHFNHDGIAWYYGAKLGVRLSKHVGIQVSARIAPGNSSGADSSYVSNDRRRTLLADAGLTFNL